MKRLIGFGPDFVDQRFFGGLIGFVEAGEGDDRDFVSVLGFDAAESGDLSAAIASLLNPTKDKHGCAAEAGKCGRVRREGFFNDEGRGSGADEGELVAAFVEAGAEADGLGETGQFGVEVGDSGFTTVPVCENLGLEIGGAVPSSEEHGTAGDPDETVKIVGVTAFVSFVDFEN